MSEDDKTRTASPPASGRRAALGPRRPPKTQLVTLQLDPEVVDFFSKRFGSRVGTRINRILRAYVSAQSKTSNRRRLRSSVAKTDAGS